MSLFVDYKLDLAEETVTSFQVHPTLHFVAVLLQSALKGEVVVFDLQDRIAGQRSITCPAVRKNKAKHNFYALIPKGKRLQHSQVLISEPHTALIKWNPVHAVLVLGLHDGVVQFFNVETDAVHVADEQMKSAIRTLCWNKPGTLLLSSDNVESTHAKNFNYVEKLQTGNVLVYEASNDTSLPSVVFRVNLEDVVHTASIPLLTSQSPLAAGVASSDGVLEGLSSSTDGKSNEILCLYYLGCRSGRLYALLSDGKLKACCTLQSGISTILLFHEKHIVVCLTEDFFLYQLKMTAPLTFENITEVKLSFRSQWPQVIWAGSGVLGFCSGENVVRIWDLTTEANFVLSMSECRAVSPDDRVTNIAFCQHRGILAAGTMGSLVLLWQREAGTPENPYGWFLRNLLTIPGPIVSLQWSETAVAIAVASSAFLAVYTEVSLAHCSSSDTSRTSISICKLLDNSTMEFDAGGSVHKLCISYSRLLIIAGDLVSVYDIVENCSLEKLSTFAYSGKEAALLGTKVCTLEGDNCLSVTGISRFVSEISREVPLTVHSMDGNQQEALISQQRSRIAFVKAGAGRLCVALEFGPLMTYELKDGEFRQLHRSPTVLLSEKQIIDSISCNVLCDCISFTFKTHNGIPGECIYIWDATTNKVHTCNLNTALAGAPNCKGDSQRSDELKSKRPLGSKAHLLAHCWDMEDRRMLFCQAALKSEAQSGVTFAHGATLVMVYFVTFDYGILVQRIGDVSPGCDTLLAAKTPYLYFNAKVKVSTSSEDRAERKDDQEARINRFLIRVTWPVFLGLENCASECKSSAIDFIIHSTAGNVDEALKVIRTIKGDQSSVLSSSLWGNIGRICVRYGTISAVHFCFRQMRNAYLGNSERFAVEDSEDGNARLGLLAMQLNLTDFATRAFVEGNRYDWINKLYQHSNDWEKAIETAESHDRIHLKNTYYHYGSFFEQSGETSKAIEWYEKAGVSSSEVLRLLVPFPDKLQEYVHKKKDKLLFRWLGKFKESNDEMEDAINCYRNAKDFSSLFRILCHQGKLEEAVRLAKESGDRAACYQLAKYYEMKGNYNEAVHFFSLSEAYKSAIRLCKECHFDEEIVDLALKGTHSVMIDAAKYYGKRQGMIDKAAMLYHKAGLHDEAISLAFQAEQFTAMNLIASEIKLQADPMMLDKCAQFFLQNKQYSKAVELLAEAKQYERAIQVSTESNIPLNEEMADLMTPSKDDIADSRLRNELIEDLADSCMKQGLYSCAAKKYIQAGSRKKAMKALIINGDWQKIVQFANAAKSRDLYVIAADYLCRLDWLANSAISSSIVQFYSKASAYGLLADFYCTWAKERADLEESGNYEVFLAHLNQSLKCLQKGGSSFSAPELSHRISETEQKIALLKRFILVKNGTIADPDEATKQLLNLLDNDKLAETLQVGDVYGLIIGQYVRRNDFAKARHYLELLQRSTPEDQQGRYLTHDIREKILQSTVKTPIQDDHAMKYDLADGKVLQ